MLKIVCSPPMTFEALGEKHYRDMNPKVASGRRVGQYYLSSVIHKLEEQIASSQGIEKEIFQFFKGPNGVRLKAILTGQPGLLQKIADAFRQKFPTVVFRNSNANGREVFNDLGKKVVGIFNYNKYRSSSNCIDNLRLIGVIFRSPCPYCNCDSMDIIEFDRLNGEESQQALLDLDHFLPQSKFPFLALSLFNLVPSCHNCNSRLKRDIEFRLETHIHPYLNAFEDHFKFFLETPYYDGITDEELEIICENRNHSVFPKNSIADLRLLSRYHSSRPEIHRMLRWLSTDRYQFMANLFGEAEAENQKQLDYNATGIPLNRSEISKYNLGKLKVDIHDDYLNVTTI